MLLNAAFFFKDDIYTNKNHGMDDTHYAVSFSIDYGTS